MEINSVKSKDYYDFLFLIQHKSEQKEYETSHYENLYAQLIFDKEKIISDINGIINLKS